MTARPRRPIIERRPTLAPPVLGDWLVLNPPGHARHAFDLLGLDAATGRWVSAGIPRLLAGRADVSRFPGWSRPVLAPAAGTVVSAHDGVPDRLRPSPLRDLPAGFVIRPLVHRNRPEAMAGNHVVLSTSAGHVLLAHLRRGSVRVAVGQQVERGTPLGLVGNSGNSLAPHLHVHVADAPDPATGRIVDFRVTRFTRLADGQATEIVEAPLPARPTRVRFTA